jgi:hypothetical protein
LIAESCRTSRKKLLRNHLAQRRKLFARAVAAGDFKAALAVLRDIAPPLTRQRICTGSLWTSLPGRLC